MKKRTKDNIGCIIAIVSVAIVIGVIWIAVSTLKPPDKDEMEKYLQQDKDDLVLITEYFINSDYSEISINESDFKKGIMFTGISTREVNIENETAMKAINRIFKRGYHLILKNGNTISFEKWCFGEEHHGLAYSINSEDEPVLQFLTELDQLSENGWYYYEEDYNEWRNQ